MIATAIIGSAVFGTVVTSIGADKASKDVTTGAASAADATIQSTEMQIAEIQRQFDYQQQLLAPFVANQYAAQSAYMDLLGIGGGAGGQPPGPGGGAPGGYADVLQPQPDGSIRIGAGASQAQVGPGAELQVNPRIAEAQAELDALNDSGSDSALGQFFGPSRQRQQLQAEIDQLTQAGGAGPGLTAPQYPGPGSTQFSRGDRGQFIDPNIDQTRLADINTLPGQVNNTLLSRGTAATSVYGDVFQESPGYAFQVEQMGRELDRRNSAGGNYGGRAVMEAQRRAQGLAAGDYYNWAQGRSRDVDRLTGAEATDASRLDAAASQEDRLMAGDQARGDQAYYNYLSQLSAAGGIGGNPTAQAVNSSQAAGSATAGAYGAQGRGLAGIYSGQGTDLANITGSQYGSYNDIIQGTVGNAVTAGYFKKPTPTVSGY